MTCEGITNDLIAGANRWRPAKGKADSEIGNTHTSEIRETSNGAGRFGLSSLVVSCRARVKADVKEE